jgi:ATP-dependent Clp protease adaptor protein ClpS
MPTKVKHPPNLVVAKEVVRTGPPPMYRVLLLNDDYTPMDYVIHVLQKFFGKEQEEAVIIMLQVHHEGRGTCGVYPHDIAASRMALVLQHAKLHQHPLQCVMEPVGN